MVATLLLVPWHWGALSAGTVDQAAVSMAPNVLAGERIKDQAFADGYLPLFGSSELARMDPFHPAVYAEKYHQPKPFLLGAAGTQSLTHFVTDQSSLPELRGKKSSRDLVPAVVHATRAATGCVRVLLFSVADDDLVAAGKPS
ncbi:D-alanyl-lipoteichoic acid biosynthesis protein DltD [Lacticaseibacillus nasuensis]|uniref:D-alanyl-lipoteichoic acid biosynthesis protein DltD n=1 Tax=Lacticaseibacillus nasuensis TaxID=944671 RepID=UPI001585799D|nr:D-alanyl-lipoteichoic acid biosynthesis protein DltD [Lacticaseibacillus nasuensis]